MRTVIGGIHNLPTPPIVFTQIQKVLNNPNTSAYDIASILQEDPAISAKVLKLTNSAYYGLTRTIESVKQAVVIIGLDAVKNLVLSASVFEMFADDQIDAEFQDFFWRHSLATAFAARLLAHSLKGKNGFSAETGFSAGLLHDIGKMVISVYMPDDNRKIKEARAERSDTPVHVLEDDIMGYNHAQIGGFLGENWTLPAQLLDAIRYHHQPQLTEDPDNPVPAQIHLANYLATYTFEVEVDADDNRNFIEPVQPEVLESVGLTLETLEAMAGSLREEYLKAETFMEMAKGM